MTTTDQQIEALKKYPTALVTDALRRLGIRGAWAGGVVPVAPRGTKMIGRAATLKYVEKNAAPKKVPGQFDIICDCKPGDVLVYAACGVSAWLIGANVVQLSTAKKLAGIIVDGCSRDLEELADLPLPVFCRGGSASPYAYLIQPEAVNVEVEFAGIKIKPGDVILGDSDGLVVIPPERVADVIFQLEDLQVVEDALAASIARGDTLQQINAIASKKGVLRSK